MKSKRDFLDVRDVCYGLVAIAEKGESGEMYNICSGRSHSIEDILRLMIEYAGIDVEIVVDETKIKSGDVDDIYGSNKKLMQTTGWQPTISVSKSIGALFK